MNRPPFPSVIDSSFMTAVRSCRQKAALEYLHHFKPKGLSVHLHAGGAFARGLEVARRAYYEEGKSEDTAIAEGVAALLLFYGDFECPADSAKSATRMAGAMVYYFDSYPMGEDAATPIHLPSGGRGIEFSFLEPIDFPHPETGEPLLYSGRFDAVVDYAGGRFGFDDKTTSSLGARWAEQWQLRSQFTAYTWGAQRGGLPLDGFLIRGISILKTKYECSQAVTYRPQWQIDRWYETLLLDLEEFKNDWDKGAFKFNLDESCNSWGGCGFKQVCLSQDPEPWLEAGFERRIWDPVTRIETLL